MPSQARSRRSARLSRADGCIDFDGVRSPTAWSIVREIEAPLRELLNTFEGGFNTVVHGMAEMYGINARYLPPPYHTMTDEQMEKLADSLKAMSLL